MGIIGNSNSEMKQNQCIHRNNYKSLNAKIMFIFLVSVFWSVAQKLILLDTSFLTSVYRSMIAQFASQKQKKYCRFNCKRSAKR